MAVLDEVVHEPEIVFLQFGVQLVCAVAADFRQYEEVFPAVVLLNALELVEDILGGHVAAVEQFPDEENGVVVRGIAEFGEHVEGAPFLVHRLVKLIDIAHDGRE